MIGTRNLGKPHSETFSSEHPSKSCQKKLQSQKSQTRKKITQLQRENVVVKTTTVENSDEDKTSSNNATSFNLDVSDNPYNLSPPPIECPPSKKTC